MPKGIYPHKPKTEEWKQIMSQKFKGKNNPFYGKKHSEETKIKIGISSKGRVNPMKGKQFSEEIKKKMSVGYKYHINSTCFKKGHKVTNSIFKKGIYQGYGFKKGHTLTKAEKNYNWKGGKYIRRDGYILILNLKHPFANCRGYLFEHRFVMEQHLNRYLFPRERVHHINGIKNDNRIENLKLFPNESEHRKYHKLFCNH